VATAVAPVSPTVAELTARVAGIPTAWIVAVARNAAALPHAAVPWPSGVGGAVLLAAGLLVGGLVLGRAARVAGRPGRLLLLGAAVLGIALPTLLLPAVVRAGWPPPDWVMVACDVGQGDALVLNAGGGTAVVVDAGPQPGAVDRCLRDLAVRRVALVLLTHLHADHVGGLPGVWRSRPVAALALGPLDEPVEQAARVARWARAAGTVPRRVQVGERGSVGGLNWRVVWPRRIIRGDGSVPNNASVVLIAERDGVRLLLAGDIEPDAQRALLPALDRVDVLKVPHHGSAYQEPRLVERTRPRVALISAGADNDYGHPASATLAQLEAAGALVLRTDRQGDLAVVGPAERLRVVARDG
jgi:competence protein ComEC